MVFHHDVVLADDRLRLRTLIIKGETDDDLDPSLSEQSLERGARIG